MSPNLSKEQQQQDEIDVLKGQVKKLQKMLLSTGQQVMQLQVELRKLHIDDIGVKAQELQGLTDVGSPNPSSNSDKTHPAIVTRPSEYVTESDLNDMVVELQGQFNILDEKSIKRSINCRSTKDLKPLPNADGEYSPTFPKTIDDLQSISRESLFNEWNFYEMVADQLEDLLTQSEEENKKLLQQMYESFSSFIGVDSSIHPWLGK
ncbi:Mrp8 protein [Starmerella bacillaris]|uniref:Mrp8 protein n=1 Tax=Starmerella bacillaris TaxID=1247836 RepID=A0AAV5RK98_STABA|nr:Mrp8 protein [Starmerella bacillaris]